MVAIQPFQALRYNPDVVSDLNRVVAPPYDVINADEQGRLYDASPYNIVRLILGKQSPGDTEDNNRYTRARRDFTAWQASDALRRDPQPALYVIEHTFAVDGNRRTRLGFLGLLGLSDAVERSVYRHEETLAAPKADRTKLLETVPANLSPVFCVYPDEGGAVQAIIEGVRDGSPDAAIRFHDDTVRLWAVTDPGTIQAVSQRLSSTAVLIADGHHRFEVARAHRDRYGAVMSYFVSMADPALVVRPIHRIVRQAAARDLEAVRRICRLEPAADLASLTRWLEAGDRHGRFGYCDGRALYQASVLPDQLARWLISPSVPLPVAALDVSLLHGLILPSLGADAAVRYTAKAEEAVETARQTADHSAWLLRGIPLAQVYALASSGFTLPPKSTYFYPKVLSGLAINPFN